MTEDPRALVDRIYRQAVVLVGALLLGVVAFASTAFALRATGSLDSPAPDPIFRWVFVGMAAFALGAARPLERRMAEVDRGAGAQRVAGAWLQSRILGAALREAVGLMGAVLVFMGDPPAGLALAGASVGLLLFAFPRKTDLEERVRRSGR